jgi:translation initiation factor 2 subunit 1|tara:strand:+ start:18199 stop:18984 length:786 start_codon:yes stop_codon:yes gene_type:complete
MAGSELWPEEGELLICVVSSVKENGAYLDLESYDGKTGFVFIGEVASGWVKNISAHLREGQRVVAKAIQVRKDKQRIELSIKSVSEERRRDTLQAWKNRQRAGQLMRVAAERVGWDEEKTAAICDEMREIFGTLFGALEECAISDMALSDAGFTGDWIPVVTELAVENIVPPFVEIRGEFDIQVWGPEGVNAIREALIAAEACDENLEEVTITCHYDGAPHYRVDIRAPDYQAAESVWEAAQKAASESMASVEGSIAAERL